MNVHRSAILRAIRLVALILWSSSALAQGTYPRSGTESLAMRLHDWYLRSQSRLAQLESDRTKVKGFINEVAPGSTMVGTAVAPEDVSLLNSINDDIAREQARLRDIEVFWSKDRSADGASFARRYGPLNSAGQRSVDAKYDKVEYAIRQFPFTQQVPSAPPPTTPVPPPAATPPVAAPPVATPPLPAPTALPKPGIYRGVDTWMLTDITSTSMTVAWWQTNENYPPKMNKTTYFGRGTATLLGDGLWRMSGKDQPGSTGYGYDSEAEFRILSPTSLVQLRTRSWKPGAARPEWQSVNYVRNLVARP